MNVKKFEEILINAIHSQQLRIVLSEMNQKIQDFPSDVQEVLQDARESIDTIDDSTLQEALSISDLLKKNGVIVLSAAPSSSQEILHMFKLSVERTELEKAVRLLEENGYFTPLRSSRRFWQRYTQFFDRAYFSSDKEMPFRVALNWQPSSKRGKLTSMLKPSVDDLKCIAIPRPLWPLYYGVKLIRRILKMNEGNDSQNLGPFLGTPQGMIGPLLEFANLQSDHALVDIGCGDGRILLKAATGFGCRVTGYETDETVLQMARSKASEESCQNLVTLLPVDAQKADVSNADVVFVFLPANVTRRIVTKLLPQMKAGSVLIAHEQHELNTAAKPTQKMPLILPCGVSVAYKWQV